MSPFIGGLLLGLVIGLGASTAAFFILKNNVKRLISTKIVLEERLRKLEQAYNLGVEAVKTGKEAIK